MNPVILNSIMLILVAIMTLFIILTVGVIAQQREKFREEFKDQKTWIKYIVDEHLAEHHTNTCIIIDPLLDGSLKISYKKNDQEGKHHLLDVKG